MKQSTSLDDLVQQAVAAFAEAGSDAPLAAEITIRDRFYELIVLALGNLFPRMPGTGNLIDRITLLRTMIGLDDNDASSLGKRSDDWLRLEGIIKQEEGKRTYFLPLQTLASLSIQTEHGLLGDVFAAILKRYTQDWPSENLRAATRALAAEYISLDK